ncbi:amidohydrolase family protein [Burkholderia cenocepacia]|uniref:amidohydrolase family protein n=1 Tax=Burkholderia cenocepacia TaxID=95486 RepID=UPI0009FD0F8A|nr:amidohydrolase family protein [Burkholderia cenocepacia]MCW3678541.1 amidohydrolase [Burkholderia cenocepacia]MDC6086069.1 amidohydrolase family protein [Burkholderia cenocepacia]
MNVETEISTRKQNRWTCGCRGRVDVHHHVSPPGWLKELKARGLLEPPCEHWSIEKSLADMEEGGVETAMLSITTPALNLSEMSTQAIATLARECNEYAARIVSDYPGRFGFFAAIPITDPDSALKETEYALDVLKADGVGLLTSYGDRWLGDPSFFPVLSELDRRGVVASTHPTTPNCCVNIQPELHPSIIEFGTDTTRAIASLLVNGGAQRFRNIKWIFSHAGGTMPFLIERFLRLPIFDARLKDQFPDGVREELRRFYYDTAQVSHTAAMAALTCLVETSQILFGTDFPYRTAVDHMNGLKACGVFNEEDLVRIDYSNAHGLLPRIAGTR